MFSSRRGVPTTTAASACSASDGSLALSDFPAEVVVDVLKLAVRQQSAALAGEAVGGGRNCAPRRNVFHCASHTLQCALP